MQHDGRKQNYCIPGTLEWEIIDNIIIEKEDIILSKEANDSFYKTKLNQIIEEYNIDELVITGCATDFCVDATIKTALTRDFNITVIADGHTTADRGDISARQLIHYYNWQWKNFIPTAGMIKVIDTDYFLKNY